MKRALVVGINDYAENELSGCVNDATSLATVLDRNEDSTKNFDVLLVTDVQRSTFSALRKNIEVLFASPADVALFYFAGHGAVVGGQAHLCSSDYSEHLPGFRMEDLIRIADEAAAKIRNRIILLDCCFSGHAGNQSLFNQAISNAVLSQGTTILTASRETEASKEIVGGHGVFTYLMVDALRGGAADILGRITPASVYSHIDQSLGAWDQRPLFKSHVDSFLVLREVRSKVSLEGLRMLPELFPDPADPVYNLSPDHEHSDAEGNPRMDGDPKLHAAFRTLQDLNRVGLVLPVGEKDMYWAAMRGKDCRLSPLGLHYRRLAAAGRL